MRAAQVGLALLLATACRPYVIPAPPVVAPPRPGAPVAVRFRAGHPGDGYTVMAEHAAGVSSCQTPCTLTLPRGGTRLRVSGARRFSQAVDIERAATWRILDPGRERRPVGVSGVVFGAIGVAVGSMLLLAHDLSASLSCSLSDQRCDEPGLGLPTILASLAFGSLTTAYGFTAEPDHVEIEPEPRPVSAIRDAPSPTRPTEAPEPASHPTSRDDRPPLDRW